MFHNNFAEISMNAAKAFIKLPTFFFFFFFFSLLVMIGIDKISMIMINDADWNGGL
jgi:hypothetical protein